MRLRKTRRGPGGRSSNRKSKSEIKTRFPTIVASTRVKTEISTYIVESLISGRFLHRVNEAGSGFLFEVSDETLL
jgi:hypothetical protein